MWKAIVGFLRGTSSSAPSEPESAPIPKIPDVLAWRGPRPGRPCGDWGVRKIETELGVILPKTLKEIIATCGFIHFKGDYFLRGFSYEAECDIISTAKSLKSRGPEIPKNGVLVPLMYAEMGQEICLWYHEGADPESSKVVWWPSLPAYVPGVREDGMLVIAGSFDEWIAELGRKPVLP